MNIKKAKSRPIPVRLTEENDLTVNRFMEGNKLQNRNLAINIMLSDHGKYNEEREKAKAEIQRLMRRWGIRLPELE